MDEQQLAAYLSMDVREIKKLAGKGRIPGRRVGERFLFTKVEIDHWVWQEMHNFNRNELRGIEKGVSRHHGMDADTPIVCPLIPDITLPVPLDARTRNGVLKGLVDIAEQAGLIYSRQHVMEELQGREQLCSTALVRQVAFPHPRHPLPYDIAESFVIPAITTSGIPFGAEDGSLTRMFFLICSKDERTHLHVLARLVRMLDAPGVVDSMMECEDSEQLDEALAHREMELVKLDKE